MILKFINGKNDSPEQLKEILEYVTDEAKTESSLIGGYCCDTKYPYEDMCVHKILHNKSNGKQYEHYVIAFDPGDDIDNETAFRVAADVAKNYKKHQSIWAVHTDTDHIHAHVIMNSVASDGKKFSQWKPELNKLKNYISNIICKKYRISPVRKLFGSKGVEEFSHLEFDEEEFNNVYGGNVMSKVVGNFDYEYDDYQYLDDENDNGYLTELDEDITEVENTHTELWLGNTYNITGNNAEKIRDVLSAASKAVTYTPQSIKAAMNYFGDGIKYHVGSQFYINLVDEDSDDAESDFIDVNYTDNDDDGESFQSPFNFKF